MAHDSSLQGLEGNVPVFVSLTIPTKHAVCDGVEAFGLQHSAKEASCILGFCYSTVFPASQVEFHWSTVASSTVWGNGEPYLPAYCVLLQRIEHREDLWTENLHQKCSPSNFSVFWLVVLHTAFSLISKLLYPSPVRPDFLEV